MNAPGSSPIQPTAITNSTPPAWKDDPALRSVANDVYFGEHSLARFAAALGTPAYVYLGDRIRENLQILRQALRRTGRPFRIHFALKCNRFGPVLDLIRAEGDIGIDACSPREVELALEHGFTPQEISVTASNLSNADLAVLARHRIHLNSDTRSAARRFAALAHRGASFGLRIDPPAPLRRGGGEKLNYIGGKFGIHPEELAAAHDFARTVGLDVNTLHVHCGWALQKEHAPAFEAAVATLAAAATQLPGIRRINVGGGLAHRHSPRDRPLDVDTWSDLLTRHLGHLPVDIECEIGTFIMANAGLLLMEVNTVEIRRGTHWLGVNSGHSVNVYPYHYGLPLELIPVSRPREDPSLTYQVGSNINEAEDLVARDVKLPDMREGDVLAMYCAGAYGSSMASDHCLRGNFAEILL